MKTEIKRFIDCYVPTEICNLKCSYCYIGQREGFTDKICPIAKDADFVRKALSRKRFGGSLFINFCAGGETLLGEDILDIVHELLEEGHIVQIVTNGTLRKRFEEICSWEEGLLDRLFIKFSYHYLELKRLGLFEVFFNNIAMVKQKGVSYTLELTPCDEMIPYIDDIKRLSMDNLGALPHVTVARNVDTSELKILSTLSKEEYVNTWGQFDSPMFDLKMRLVSEKRCEFCYAGEWTLYLNIMTGDLRQCYKGNIVDNIYKDIDSPIKFKPIGRNCRESYCFNGHAWLTWGSIPNMGLPTYADMRNRVTKGGSEWLSATVKSAFSCKLENTNTIYDNTDDIPKVLMIGDSVLAGYIDEVKKQLGDKAYIYYNGSNAQTSTNLYRFVSEWADDMKIGSNIDVVHFNVGLWDVIRWNDGDSVVGLKTYERNLRKIVWQLKYLFPSAKIIFSTTTPVGCEEWYYRNSRWTRRNEDIEKYNQVATVVMKENNIHINDLWKYVTQDSRFRFVDQAHFSDSDYQILGQQVADIIGHEISQIVSLKATLKLCNNEFEDGIDKLNNRRVIIYGASDYGKRTIKKLISQGITPSLILDSKEELRGKHIEGVAIESPQVYISEMSKKDDVIIISIQNKGIWNNVCSIFSSLENVSICSYEILRVE
ncbi:MAG: hypothetical protein IJX12_07475 [Lachnospiraceae bacterium]|nr:hypothetical protein [Lachnospiraceae bacterium]